MNAESAAGRDELFDSAKPQQGQMLTDRQTEKPISPSTLIYILIYIYIYIFDIYI